jgi:hypothetical protein
MIYSSVQIIESQAAENEQGDKKEIQHILSAASINTDMDLIIKKLLYDCDVTINFHPDRFSNNGKLIIENLLADGEYHNQHKTGTSNGGLGGNRDSWEKRLFQGAYHDGNSEMADRPKYGALNIHNYIDGAASRFGSCFFTIKPHVVGRCTFAFGDSSTNPDVMGTSRQFYGVIKSLLQRVVESGKLVEKEGFTVKKAVDHILSMQKGSINGMGRVLDNICLETHIHGNLSLLEDIESLFIDEFYVATDIFNMIKAVCERYEIKLCYIPKRQFQISKIDDEDWYWKGVPLTRTLADRINEKFACNGLLNAVTIGLASQDSMTNKNDWLDIGSEYDLFQNFKKLWHYCAYWG